MVETSSTRIPEVSTMGQFSKLIEFRQAVYDHGLTRAKDAQFELVDALLLSPPIRSFPELSLSPAFRRQWPSVYAAVEDGSQDVAWLERYFVQHIPTTGVQVYPLDGTAWAHPGAKTMSDRHAAQRLQSDDSGQRWVGCGRASILSTGVGTGTE
jgi:hypothetical protein